MQNKLVILGLGVKSTLFYQKTLHDLYFKKYRSYSTCPFILKQINFNTINPYLPNGHDIIAPILKNTLENYNSSKINLLVPNITLHNILDTLDFKLNIIHPIKLLEKKTRNSVINKCVVFGTRHTKANSSIGKALQFSNIQIIGLNKDEVSFLDVLRQAVYNGTETLQDINKYNQLLKEYSEEYLVIIACSELSVINTNHTINIIDLARMQCEEAVLTV
ncbi:aspartate/glutamate racemase family protein [Lacinutrix sp. 5H-3-7-4]|uniref:aspartate/glutamate racemase family protein n=1 Tax=Lacinutrix sp. (strain 5H-3-7-4) TaxID=983544 RepID=UPI00020A3348|nr:aspartate/glutamate racemase family protein [Lacinutrix sp. 5H-3-7-4]AEH02394.1 hypothetical protein Lacal_2553 [Lacinutrix sp. 5H-3-7-4]